MNIEFLNDLDNYIAGKRYRLVNSVLVYEKDEPVFERYYNKSAPDSRNQIKSVWKSIMSLTLGICLDKGMIPSLDEPVCRYLEPFDNGNHPWHKLITVRHLLTMSSGIYWTGGIHYHCPMIEQMRRTRDWVEHIADVRMADFPGTRFVYKEWDIILLSSLIGKCCGGAAWDICNDYLYKPLGIAGEEWAWTECGVSYPSYGEDMTDALSARDMAKIGLLMLRGGAWNGRRIVSGDYLTQAITPSPVDSGYGFLWWLSGNGYHGRGFGGQELNVYPDVDIVAVVQASVTSSSKSYEDICAGIIETSPL